MAALLDFDPEEFALQEEEQGETIRWFEMARCSCFDPAIGDWNHQHSICSGSGFIKTEKSLGSKKVIVLNVSQTTQIAHFGRVSVGEIILSAVPTAFDPGPLAEVIITSRSLRIAEPEILTRGADDKLRFVPVVKMQRVFSTNGSISDYTEGTHYTINKETGIITWVSGGPSVGQRYSVDYTYSPRYTQRLQTRRVRKSVEGVALPVDTLWRLMEPTEFRG